MALDLIHSDPPAVPRPWLAGGLHYVGSTAVPGLVAKPILDMIAGVRDLTDASAAIGALAALSYAHAEHRPRALCFYKPAGAAPQHHSCHLHLTAPGSDLWRERLAFRDALRADPELARVPCPYRNKRRGRRRRAEAMTANPAGAMQVEIDGVAASPDQLRAAALGGYGHFTAMQVRGGRVRAFGRHLDRLDAANRELFGAGIDAAAVRDHIRHALGDDICDASVRVYVLEADGSPFTLVTVRPPGGMPGAPWKLRAVPYQRSLAHIKHTGDFGQRYYQRLAHARGFDEALLTGPDAIISEGSITNVGFFDGAEVIWPAAPALAGITMQLLERALADHGLPSRRAHVRLTDLGSFAAVFVTNARGIAPVGQVDDLSLTADTGFMRRLAEAYESAGWDSI